MIVTTSRLAGFRGLPTDAQAERIAKRVRGDGLFTFKHTLGEACADVGADCSDILPRARCIEAFLRSETFWVTRDGVTVRGGLLDADDRCVAAGDDGTIPTGGSSTGVSLALLALVGAAGFAWFRLRR